VPFSLSTWWSDKDSPWSAKLTDYLGAFFNQNPDFNFDVFIHKSESFGETYRFDLFRLFQQKASDEIMDLPLSPSVSENPEDLVQYHLTSVHTYTIHEAFSKVFHKLLEPMSYLEDLLNIFCASEFTARKSVPV